MNRNRTAATPAGPSRGGREARQRTSRVAAFTLCFSLGCSVVPVLAYRALDRAGVEYEPYRLNLVHIFAKPLARLERNRDRPGVVGVAVLGDSTSISYPNGQRVHERLRQQVNRLAHDLPRIYVQSLGSPGTGPFDHYFVADLVAKARPDQVVIGFNFASMGVGWRTSQSRPELAGFIGASRLVEAIGLPLHWIGLRTDQLLFYSAIIGAGGYDPWRLLQREQVRIGAARESVEKWVGDLVGDHPEDRFQKALGWALLKRGTSERSGHNRLSASHIRLHYGQALTGTDRDHPVLRLLGATVAHLERAGVQTLVYTIPLNIEHIDSMGLYDDTGLAHTLASIEATIREAGGQFVDLHDLLPDQGFRDAPGHFTVEGPIDGPARVAEALAPHVLSEARRSRAARR